MRLLLARLVRLQLLGLLRRRLSLLCLLRPCGCGNCGSNAAGNKQKPGEGTKTHGNL
jgi:hypothetical protein